LVRGILVNEKAASHTNMWSTNKKRKLRSIEIGDPTEIGGNLRDFSEAIVFKHPLQTVSLPLTVLQRLWNQTRNPARKDSKSRCTPKPRPTEKEVMKNRWKDECLVYVRYRDHVLFRNANRNLHGPAIRETVGWLIKENADAVWILWDRGVEPLHHEKVPASESGLVILKSDVLEMRKIA